MSRAGRWLAAQVARDLVNGIVAYDRAHPGKVLLVTGLSTDQFYSGFADRPFETVGLQNVFIAPDGARNVDDVRGWLPRYDLPPGTVKALLDSRARRRCSMCPPAVSAM